MSLQNVLLSAFKSQLSALGDTITFIRGEKSFTLKALVGSTAFRIDTDYNVSEHIESRDYLVLASDLQIDGVAITPQRYDHIQQTIGNQTITYDCLSPGDEPIYKWHDPYRQVIRIHTKQLAVTENS